MVFELVLNLRPAVVKPFVVLIAFVWLVVRPFMSQHLSFCIKMLFAAIHVASEGLPLAVEQYVYFGVGSLLEGALTVDVRTRHRKFYLVGTLVIAVFEAAKAEVLFEAVRLFL